MPDIQTLVPRVEHRAAVVYCALPVSVRMDTIGADVPGAYDELETYMSSRGIQPAGPALLRYRTISETAPFVIDVGWVTEEAVWIDSPYVADVLPEGDYVVLTYEGPYADLSAATGRALDWATAQNLKFDAQTQSAGDDWASWYELYETDPVDGPRGPEGTVTICLKVREPSAGAGD